MHYGLAIDPNTNDLMLTHDNNLSVVTGAEAVGQHVRQRLMTFQGEWFLDNTAGVTWLSEIFAKQYNPELAEAVVKNEILDTDGVTEISSFSVAFANNIRQLIIRNVEVSTIYGQEVSV